jgi:acyl-CoA hydrolase
MRWAENRAAGEDLTVGQAGIGHEGTGGMSTGTREVVLRLLATPTEVAALGETRVAAGRVLEWIDKAAYACAVGWSRTYCVTVYVGNISFARPISSGELVETRAELVHTGRSSMHIEVTVSAADPQVGMFALATSCTVVFVAMGEDGRPAEVPPWTPQSEEDHRRDAVAIEKIEVRAAIESAMREQSYTEQSLAPSATLRFLAAPTDVNWGGKTHGGTVMRWIDEAAYVCAVGWSGSEHCVAAYSGGVRFYKPIRIGDLVEVDARLLYTGRRSMHVSVHVRSGDPRTPDERVLTTHCLTVFVALDASGRAAPVPRWRPTTDEDRRLEAHARHLMELRSALAPPYPT